MISFIFGLFGNDKLVVGMSTFCYTLSSHRILCVCMCEWVIAFKRLIDHSESFIVMPWTNSNFYERKELHLLEKENVNFLHSKQFLTTIFPLCQGNV